MAKLHEVKTEVTFRPKIAIDDLKLETSSFILGRSDEWYA